jgi:hypothetical protein
VDVTDQQDQEKTGRRGNRGQTDDAAGEHERAERG